MPTLLPLLLLACTPDDPVDTASDTSSDTDTGECVPTTPSGSASALDAACACEAATVEIGGGSLTFEPYAEGDGAVMVHGPPGGWHVEASMRVTNTVPIVAIRYTIDAEGARISDNSYRVQILQDGPCTGYYPGMYGYLNVAELALGEADTPPELLGGKELLLTMEITDFEGRTASDTLRMIAELDPIDVGGR